jgi:hypothetical protein
MDQEVVYGVGSGGCEPAREAVVRFFTFYTRKFTYCCELRPSSKKGTQCQPEKAMKAMCNKLTDRTKWTIQII